ncbi:hypothetical protein BJ165DRAFT_185754 [Panaeolus papilionaceus]|nr:hypothetical protein BJ165DRAFT_185754 [Panaeolus papilionaceus]
MVLAFILEKRSLQQDVFTRNLSSLAALIVLIWEYLVCVQDERRFIWRGSFNKVKAIYLFSRYLGLCAQIANVVLVFNPLSQLPVPRSKCKAWFLCLCACSCSLLVAIDVALILRVHVLYNRSRRVGCFLFGLVALQCGIVTRFTVQKIDVVPFDGICNVQETPVDTAYFMASIMVTQTTLLFMTVAKRKIAFGQSPVIDLVVRDGAWIFVLVFALAGTTIPYSLFVQISKPHLILIWPIALLSLACCRLILNMQKLGLHLDDDDHVATVRDQESTGIAFTSFIDTAGSLHSSATHVHSTISSNSHRNALTS